MAKEELTGTIRNLLRNVMRARFEGGAYAKLARANGYADGYMRALMDAGVVDQRELLALVGAERQRFVDEAPALASQAV
jgi:hypothetical protein